MNVLIIGAGGREHALAWKLAQDPRLEKIYLAPGNGAPMLTPKLENVAARSIEELLAFAQQQAIDLTIVGSEALLVEGIVDRFQQAGLAIFGPNQNSARLEGSKAFAKDFMQKYGVKTAAYASFRNPDAARAYLQTQSFPVVLKASGLAAGKGVIICKTPAEAEQALLDLMVTRKFGAAGDEIVIEQFLQGFEASLMCVSDGQHIALLPSAKDHKTIGEHGQGENTGGMGAIAPHPQMTPALLQAFQRDILQPTQRGLCAEGLSSPCVIFFGLMISDSGEVFLLEYNMRMGDPETQAVLPLLETPLLDIFQAALAGTLAELPIKTAPKNSVCVVAASQGYPGAYRTGYPITGLQYAAEHAQIFIAGAAQNGHLLCTSGGRVLNAVGLGDTLTEARVHAYRAIDELDFEGLYCRRDIGL